MLLSDERIRELAIMAVSPYYYWSPSVDQAIRLAVAEAVEECAVVCDDIAEQYHLIFNDQDKARVSEECAAAIREKAEEKK